MSNRTFWMTALRGSLTDWSRDIWRLWDEFMFTPADAATLGLIRILAGAMLLYTHFVWTLDLSGFFGTPAILSNEFVYGYHDSVYAWSHLYLISSSWLLWFAHLAGLIVFAMLMIGYQTRIVGWLACALTISYAHRATGALFGLDQVNGFLALYLAVGPSGDVFSVDAWLARRRGAQEIPWKTSANVAIRLMQLHLCVVYLFAGLGKLLGESWWEGTALWGAFANQEYQTWDMTWMAHSLVLVNLLTHVTLIWEVSYAALVWHRLARPVMLLLAIPLHLGIALCMGMITFGLAMLIANLSFVSPVLVRRCATCFFAQGTMTPKGMNQTTRGPRRRPRKKTAATPH